MDGPQGPCIDDIAAAAEGTMAVDVQAAKGNPEKALNAANAVSECTVAACASACEM